MLRHVLVFGPRRVRAILTPSLGCQGMSICSTASLQPSPQIRGNETSRRFPLAQTYNSASAAEAEVVLRSAKFAISQGGTLTVDNLDRYFASQRLSDGSCTMIEFVQKRMGGLAGFFRKHSKCYVVLDEEPAAPQQSKESPTKTWVTVGLTQPGARLALKDARERSDVADALRVLEFMGAPFGIKTLPEVQPASAAKGAEGPFPSTSSSAPSDQSIAKVLGTALASTEVLPSTASGMKALKSLLGKRRAKESDYVCAVLACKNGAQWKEAVAIVDAMDRDFATRQRRCHPSRSSSSSRKSNIRSSLAATGTKHESDANEATISTASTKTTAAPAQSTRHYPVSAAISVCARANQPEAALKLLRSLDGEGMNGSPDAVCFGAALDACAKAGWWRAAKQILLVEMPSAGLAPNTHCCAAAISSCGNAGELQEALQLLDWMRAANSSPAPPNLPNSADNKYEYNSDNNNTVVVDSFNPSPSVAATAMASSLLAPNDHPASLSLRPPPPNLWCYGAAVAACDRASQGADGATAVALLDQMSSDGLTPNVVVLNAALSACGKAGLFAEALDVLHRRFPEANAIPDTITFNAAIHACACSRITGGGGDGVGIKAPPLVTPRLSHGQLVRNDSSSANRLGNGSQQSDQGPWTAALALLDAMERDEGGDSSPRNSVHEGATSSSLSSLSSSSSHSSSSFSGATTAAGSGPITTMSDDLWDDAFREAGVTGFVPSNNSTMSTSQQQQQQQYAYTTNDRSGSSSGSMSSSSSSGGGYRTSSASAVAPKADVVSYTSAIAASGNAGQVDHAMMLLEEMMFLSEMGHRGVEPNVVSFGAALAACAKAGRWQRCLTLLKEMSLRGLAPNGPCFDTAIDALEAAGQTAEADRVYGLALAAGVYQPYSSMTGNDPSSAQPRVYDNKSRVDSSSTSSTGNSSDTGSNISSNSSSSSSSSSTTAHEPGEACDWDVVDLHSCSAVRCRVALRAALERYKLPPSSSSSSPPTDTDVADTIASSNDTHPHTAAAAAAAVAQSSSGLHSRSEAQAGGERPLPKHGLLVVTGIGGAMGAAKRLRRNARNDRYPGECVLEQPLAAPSSRPSILAEAHSSSRRSAPPVLPEGARRFLVQTLGPEEEVLTGRSSATLESMEVAAAEQSELSQLAAHIDDARDPIRDSGESNAVTYAVPGNKGRLVVPRKAIERWLASDL